MCVSEVLGRRDTRVARISIGLAPTRAGPVPIKAPDIVGNGHYDHISNRRPHIRATFSSLQTSCGPTRTESSHCLLRAAARCGHHVRPVEDC